MPTKFLLPLLLVSLTAVVLAKSLPKSDDFADRNRCLLGEHCNGEITSSEEWVGGGPGKRNAENYPQYPSANDRREAWRWRAQLPRFFNSFAFPNNHRRASTRRAALAREEESRCVNILDESCIIPVPEGNDEEWQMPGRR